MARKKISKFLSDGAVVLFAVLICALNVNVQAQIEGTILTYTISGSVGQPGVTMRGLPDTVTDGNGDYSAVVRYGWKGTVTPVLAGFTFKPQQTSYPKVTSDQPNQDYVAKIKTYKISGLVTIGGKPMEGVAMDGLPGTPVTAANGTYEAIVDFGFTGSATPMKGGYLFNPGTKSYTTAINRDMPNQNYAGNIVTFTIKGSAGVEGVTLKGLPGDPKSGKNGIYSATVRFNWTGMVKPEKDGHTFEPAEMPYTDIMSSYQNQDYYANPITFTISGNAGMDSVEMTGLPGPDVFTDGNGDYTAIVEWGWNGTVKPVKAGYKFVPSTGNYTKLIADKTHDYTPEPVMLTISGSTGMEGVTMEGLPGNLVTGPGGAYSATVDWGFSGMVIPMKDGYEFNPVDKTYAAITKNQKTNYTGKGITFTISGSVGVGGATLKGLPGRAVMTNPDGTYKITVKYGWKGTITPAKAGYTFDPAEIEYPELYGPEVNRDYYASKEKRTIAGTIRTDKGTLVEGIFVVADSDGGSATTNENGEYELTVDYGWRGTVTPSLLGHNFRPTNKRYAVPTTRNQTNQVFTAIVRTFTISDTVMIGGTGISGVKVTANNGGGTAVTNDKGQFSVEVPYNWTGEIALEKEGFSFPSKPYTSNIIENWKDDMPVSEIIPLRRLTPTPTPTPGQPTVPTPGQPTVTVPQGDQWTGGAIPVPAAPAASTEPEKPLSPLEQIQKQLDELIKQREAPAATEPGVLVPQVVLISNTFIDDPLIDVLQNIAADAKVTIIPDETVLGNVACTLKDVTVETALDIVLAGTPYIWKKTEHFYLVASGQLTIGGLQNTLFAQMSETHRRRMSYVTAEAAVGLLSTAFRPYVQAEIGLPGTDTFTVVVTASPALAERIMADLKKIDKVRQQVLLDARIVVMERGNLLNLGVQWGFPTVSAGLFGNDLRNRGAAGMLDLGGKIASGFSIGYAPDATFTSALTATLNLLAQNDEATIIANPQVLAQDGKMADISVMTEEYYFMTGNQGQTTGFFNYYSELEKIESGTKLNITPHIGDNNDITLDLAIEVSDSIPRGRESDLPVVTRRTSSSTVRIKNGGTVALAGLTENRTRTDKRRVPGLSKLPLIGGLFKNTNDEGAAREIAVFITAHIIPETSEDTNYTQQPTYGIQAPMGQAPIQRQASAPTRQAQMGMGQAPSQPMEGDFRASLRRSLSRPIR